MTRAVVRGSSPVLIGRDVEVEQLAELARSLITRAPGVALVSGRAGIGKTRLIDEASVRWAGEGVQVLRGGCLPIDGAPPYHALAAALRSAGPLSPVGTAAFGGGTDLTRSQLFALARTELLDIAARGPTVLVVEDLHWSDRATRDLLAYLVSAATEQRWAMVTTFRYEGPLARAQLAAFADMVERRPIVRLALEVLAPDDVALVIASITGTPPSPGAAADVHRRSGGIPLLVEEVVAAGDAGVPDHLRNLFLTRVEALGPAVRPVIDVLAAAAVAIDEVLVAAVLDRDPPGVRDDLARAVDADLLAVQPDGYRLRHELLREVVSDDLAPGMRRDLHARLATQLDGRPGTEPALLAHHWYEAARPVEAGWACLTAAREAERIHAPAAVHVQRERLLELWPGLGDDLREAIGGRDELLRTTAVAAERAGRFARAAALTHERVQSGTGDPAARALQLERLARYRWQAGDGPGAQAAYEEAVASLPIGASAEARAKVLSGHAWFLGATFDLERARARSDEAHRAAAVVDDPAVRWQVLLSWGVARLGEAAGHRALLEARDLAVGLDAGYNAALSHLWLNNSLQLCGSPQERETVLLGALDSVAIHGLGRSVEAAASFMLAELMLEISRWDEAEQILRRNEHSGVEGMSRYFTAGLRARLAAFRGDRAAMTEAAKLTSDLSRDVPQQPVPHAMARLAEAEMLLWDGDAAGGTAAARDALALAVEDRLYRVEALALLARAQADVALAKRASGPTSATGDELLGHAAEWDVPTNKRLHALILTATAEVGRGRGRRDPAPWRAAADAWAATEDRYRLACTRWRLAWALLGTRSGRSEATRELHAAWSAATELGANPLLRAVEALAHTARLPVGPSGAVDGTRVAVELGLTARELEVLPLLASGRTNAEIAAALVISPRTVGVHVSQILRKLGAARRTEAADLARRAGLLDR